MLNLINFIVWNPSISFGPFRWYSLCWLRGLALAYFTVRRLSREQHIKDEYFDPLFFYCFVGILVGARLGHCIFYQPDYFLTSGKGFVEMLLPIHFMADGGWKQFDLVPEEYEIRDCQADYTGRVCVIGTDLNEAELLKLFHIQ